MSSSREGELSDIASTEHRTLLLIEGGPTYRLELRMGLDSTHILRRALISMAVTWLPLWILSALQGTATGGPVHVPFLRDFAVHARFLLAVPLLLAAETVLGPRLADAADQFVESGLVGGGDLPKFDFAIESSLKSRDSITAEVILIFLAYAVTTITLKSLAIHISTWYAASTDVGVSLTWAGWWFVLFCVPLFQFLTLRWLWRLFLWGQFLWRVNQLSLQLIPTHPDHAGGLAFVGESQRFFGVVLFAYSITVAGVLANGVIYDRFSLRHFAPAIATYVLVAVLIFLMPLLVFAKVLLKTKRLGLYQYGKLSTEYTSAFQKKWVSQPRKTGEILLGTADLQSLADLGNSYAYIEKMSALPMGPRTPIDLALACLIPMAPLLLTIMPMAEILKIILKVVT
jgi:hypothetical protein